MIEPELDDPIARGLAEEEEECSWCEHVKSDCVCDADTDNYWED